MACAVGSIRDAANRGGRRQIYHLMRLIGPKLIVEPIEVAMGGFRCISKRLSLSRISDLIGELVHRSSKMLLEGVRYVASMQE